MVDRRLIETPHGTARLLQRRSASPWATLVLTHGAGGGIDSTDLDRLSLVLPRQGISVALVEQPWRVAGRRIAPAGWILDEAFICAVDRLRSRTPTFVGGRSAGARVACRTGRRLGAVGVVALAFPLHPPGQPDNSRADELTAARLPVLVVQGERDPFGAPREFPPVVSLATVRHGDHALAVPAASGSREHTANEIAAVVRTWISHRLRHV